MQSSLKSALTSIKAFLYEVFCTEMLIVVLIVLCGAGVTAHMFLHKPVNPYAPIACNKECQAEKDKGPKW